MLDDDFVFGVATSAYQIEGAWDVDGKKPSIWDDISHNKHKYFRVQGGHVGDVSCDHYHRWMEDVEFMKELGVKAYRFSISWSRICTSKCMCSNLKGIKFYQDLVKKLVENDIIPFVTLYHWDIPVWLDELGGWSNPCSVDYFKCYAETMFNALPEVKNWITFNEPAVFVNNFWGHKDKARAIKNVLLAHGQACNLKHDSKIGISLNLMPVFPDKYRSADEKAMTNLDKIHNRVWLDPILKGELPENINSLNGFKKNELKLSKKEKEIINYPIDFLGINYYTALKVRYDDNNPPTYIKVVPDKVEHDEMGTEIKPYDLYAICKKIQDEYSPDLPIYITENGCAYPDVFVHDKAIHDHERIRYIRQHLQYCNQTIKQGINLKGYFYWSLMDNFEWLFGYNKKFGLLYVFWPTQSRIPKDSYYYYQKIIKNQEFRKQQLEEKI